MRMDGKWSLHMVKGPSWIYNEGWRGVSKWMRKWLWKHLTELTLSWVLLTHQCLMSSSSCSDCQCTITETHLAAERYNKKKSLPVQHFYLHQSKLEVCISPSQMIWCAWTHFPKPQTKVLWEHLQWHCDSQLVWNRWAVTRWVLIFLCA